MTENFKNSLKTIAFSILVH